MFWVFFLYPFILLLTYHPDLSSPNVMPCFHFSDGKPREPAPLVQPPLPRRTLITNSGFIGLLRGFMFPKCRILLFDSFYIFQWHCPVLQTLFFHSFWRQCRGDVPGWGTWPPGGRRLLASCPTSLATTWCCCLDPESWDWIRRPESPPRPSPVQQMGGQVGPGMGVGRGELAGP